MLRWLMIFCLLLFANGSFAGEGDDPPAAAPPHFSQVVGNFRLSSSAAPTEVAVEQPITLKVQIIGQASPRYQPERKNLRLFPEDVERSFYIEAVPEQDSLLPEKNVWEFVYRLRPKSTHVTAVPGLRLVYYAPVRNKFQTTFADEIPITVRAPASTPPKIEDLKIMPLPERFYQLYPAEEVLRDDRPLRVTPLAAAILFTLPPFFCLGWYVFWRIRHPDAQKQVQLRRSRAARLALAYLKKQNPDAVRSAATLADYLRQRFDLPASEPTPREVERLLRRLGAIKPTCRAWGQFFQTCDRLRFASAPPLAVPNIPAEATRLIHELEADPCTTR